VCQPSPENLSLSGSLLRGASTDCICRRSRPASQRPGKKSRKAIQELWKRNARRRAAGSRRFLTLKLLSLLTPNFGKRFAISCQSLTNLLRSLNAYFVWKNMIKKEVCCRARAPTTTPVQADSKRKQFQAYAPREGMKK
jgi:hypothetical protein